VTSKTGSPSSKQSRAALRFVLTIGVLSFFADFTYEGARSVIGPFLATLGATAFAVSTVTGFGEFVGYGVRLLSGRAADRTGKFWPIAIAGYTLQMVSVPCLTFAGSWPAAAGLIIAERLGKAIRNPPRDVMLSHAGTNVGLGWAFGVHEALDQFGALVGPLVVAALLTVRHDYHLAFAVLAVPAAINLLLVGVARAVYPHPEALEKPQALEESTGYPRVFWIYLAGAVLVAAGFADYPLIAYHFAKSGVVGPDIIPVFYAVAMGVSGTGSLVFGRLFDRFGFRIIIGVSVISAAFAPLVFLSGFWGALAGAAIWGLGMGVHESIIPAAVTPMVPASRRASAYGLFTAGYGIFWFLGSAVMGALYDRSVLAATSFCVAAELAAVPIFIVVFRIRSAERVTQ